MKIILSTVSADIVVKKTLLFASPLNPKSPYIFHVCAEEKKKRNVDGMNRTANVNFIMRSFSFSAMHTTDFDIYENVFPLW